MVNRQIPYPEIVELKLGLKNMQDFVIMQPSVGPLYFGYWKSPLPQPTFEELEAWYKTPAGYNAVLARKREQCITHVTDLARDKNKQSLGQTCLTQIQASDDIDEIMTLTENFAEEAFK